VAGIVEKMIDNRFSVGANAIKQRLIDELRRLRRQPKIIYTDHHDLVLTYKMRPHGGRTPEQLAQARSFLEMLESPPNEPPAGIRGIMAALADLYKDPAAMSGMTESQVKEETVKGAARHRDVSLRQARKDWKKFAASAGHSCRHILDELRSLIRG